MKKLLWALILVALMGCEKDPEPEKPGCWFCDNQITYCGMTQTQIDSVVIAWYATYAEPITCEKRFKLTIKP